MNHRSAAVQRTRIALVGNCQVLGLAKLMNAMNPRIEATGYHLTPELEERFANWDIEAPDFGAMDLIWAHPSGWTQRAGLRWPDAPARTRLLPNIDIMGFHPDCVYLHGKRGEQLAGPLGPLHSLIAAWAWTEGKSVAETVALYREPVYRQLGYFGMMAPGEDEIIARGRQCGLELAPLLQRWKQRGCWLHMMNHPKLFVLADLARLLLAQVGVETLPGVEDLLTDDLARPPGWPVYPEIARVLGLEGAYAFKTADDHGLAWPQFLGLAKFVRLSFESYDRLGSFECSRLQSSALRGLSGFLARERAAPAQVVAPSATPAAGPPIARERGSALNPYAPLPDTRYWRRSVEKKRVDEVDPVLRTGFRIAPTDRVATAGSCFAQNISRTLAGRGFNYFVTEDGAALDAAQREQGGYAVFSARFGNLYTTRQLLQLLRRAYGRLSPIDQAWRRADGRYVDPFRPYIEPAGFASPEAVAASREQMFAAVRRMFEQADVFIFTLGLTEVWRNRRDGAVFPLAPGVVSEAIRPDDYEFVNLDARATVSDLCEFFGELERVNPRIRVVLTVSPVPIIATYEDRSVLVSSTYTKSVLRVAADEVSRLFGWVDYFPSYEVVASHFHRGAYYAEDLRSVTPAGVEHVMRLFMTHYTGEGGAAGVDPELVAAMRELSALVCEEERLDAQPGPSLPTIHHD